MLLILLIATQAAVGGKIGDIEFFGYKGIDIAKIRKVLPVCEGYAYSNETKSVIRQAVVGAIGKQPTDVAATQSDSRP